MSQHLHPSLILAPSKRTTVVTTTTVTTTSYAPIPLPPVPSPSSPKDPKQYPLLKAHLPKSLREFPIEFPDGVKAMYRDTSQDAEDGEAAWEDEPVGGSGWTMIRPTLTHDGREEVINLQEAVERLNPLKKRPLSGTEHNAQDDLQGTSILSGNEPQGPSRYNNAPPRKKARGTDQVPSHPSRSVAGPPSPLPSPRGSPSTPVMWTTPSQAQSPPTPPPFQPDLSVTALLSLPNVVSHFSALPPQLQSHVLVSLLRHSPLPVLRTLHSILAPTLARDFLTLLPPELTSIILSYLQPQTLFCASRVSKAWRAIIDSDPQVWRDQLRRSGTWYGGPSENAYAERITALRAKRDEPFLYPSLHLPHPFKLLFKSRHMTLTRWQQNNPRRIRFAAHGGNVVTCLIFSRRRIISASDDHSINMYSPFTGQLIRSFPGHEGGVWALAVCSRRRKPDPSPILTPAHSPSRSAKPKPYYHDMLVSGATDRTVRIWDLQTGRNTHVFGGHTSTVRCLVIARPVWVDAEDGSDRKEKWPKHTMIVTGSRDNTLRVWRLPGPNDPEYRCFGAQMTEGDPSDEDTNENPYHVMALRGHDNAVRALAVHGRTIVSGSYDTTVRVWDLVTGECKYTLIGHSQKVYSVVIDHMRKQTCSGSMDGTVRIWSLKDGSILHILSGHTSLVGLLSLSATTLVSAAADSTLRIWDPETGKLLHVLSGHTGAITCFQHDENKVLSGSDGTLKMWDTRDGTVTRDLLTGITGVWQVVFDRRFCVAASNRQDNSFLEVWDFAADGDDVGEDGVLGADDDDNNSETSDPYDELRLAEADVEDSESEDEGDVNGQHHEDVFPDPEDSDYVMESISTFSESYGSPTPSRLTPGPRNPGPLRRRYPDTDTMDTRKSPPVAVPGYPLVWNPSGRPGPSTSSTSQMVSQVTTTSTGVLGSRSNEWISVPGPSSSTPGVNRNAPSGSRGPPNARLVEIACNGKTFGDFLRERARGEIASGDHVDEHRGLREFPTHLGCYQRPGLGPPAVQTVLMASVNSTSTLNTQRDRAVDEAMVDLTLTFLRSRYFVTTIFMAFFIDRIQHIVVPLSRFHTATHLDRDGAPPPALTRFYRIRRLAKTVTLRLFPIDASKFRIRLLLRLPSLFYLYRTLLLVIVFLIQALDVGEGIWYIVPGYVREWTCKVDMKDACWEAFKAVCFTLVTDFAAMMHYLSSPALHPIKPPGLPSRPDKYSILFILAPILDLTIYNTMGVRKRWGHSRLFPSVAATLIDLAAYWHSFWWDPSSVLPKNNAHIAWLHTSLIGSVLITFTLKATAALLLDGDMGSPRLSLPANLTMNWEDDVRVSLMKLALASLGTTSIRGFSNELAPLNATKGRKAEITAQILPNGQVVVRSGNGVEVRSGGGLRREIKRVTLVKGDLSDPILGGWLRPFQWKLLGRILKALQELLFAFGKRVFGKFWPEGVVRVRIPSWRWWRAAPAPQTDVALAEDEVSEEEKDDDQATYRKFLRGVSIASEGDSDYAPSETEPDGDGDDDQASNHDTVSDDEQENETPLSLLDQQDASIILSHILDNDSKPMTRLRYRGSAISAGLTHPSTTSVSSSRQRLPDDDEDEKQTCIE
ncbi:SCF ubiquitin ligase complex subunit cdc4 [Tulasnella sp. 403]|nr:SCF ubiquitin ligase complex subunit cdc4 [Tulasnella sp. 403]